MTTHDMELFIENYVNFLLEENNELSLEYLVTRIKKDCHELGYIIIEAEEANGLRRYEFSQGLDDEALERIDDLRFIGNKVTVHL